jgi:hypothetical protein
VIEIAWNSFLDSTQRLSQNAGQVSLGKLDHKKCLKTGVHSIGPKCEGMDFGIGRNALE